MLPLTPRRKVKLNRLASKFRIPTSWNDVRLAAYKNRYRGRRAFLVGNGPSLRIQDLDKLKGEICMGSNKIYLAFDETDWRPDFIFFEDQEVIKHTRDKLDLIEGIQVMMPHTASLPVDNLLQYHYAWLKLPPPLMPDFGVHPQEAFYWGFTVTFTMLQWAYFCGIREVYLLGIDFKYVVDKPQEVKRDGLTQFYQSSGEANHFHKDYYTPGVTWMIPDLGYQKMAFCAAKRHYDRNGAQIFNATRGGELEVFPRVSFDEVVEKRGPSKLLPEPNVKPDAYIFGAGTGGSKTLNFFHRYYRVKGFVDNAAEKHGTTLDNLPVLSPSVLSEQPDTTVIIGSQHYEAISRKLMEDGLDPDRIVVAPPEVLSGLFQTQPKYFLALAGAAVTLALSAYGLYALIFS